MKTCKRCGVTKPYDDYSRQGRSIPAPRAVCKVCRVQQDQEARLADPTRRREVRRASRLLREYRLGVDDFDDMWRRQGGACPICLAALQPGRETHIDHDHACCASERSCGACIRGLLCVACNHGLGNFRDRPDSLARAAVYLTTYRRGTA